MRTDANRDLWLQVRHKPMWCCWGSTPPAFARRFESRTWRAMTRRSPTSTVRFRSRQSSALWTFNSMTTAASSLGLCSDIPDHPKTFTGGAAHGALQRRFRCALLSMEHWGVAEAPVPPTDVLEALAVAPSAARRVGHTNVWLVTGADTFVLRAHRAPSGHASGTADAYRLSGLAALAVAGLPRSSSDPVTQVVEAVAWVHDALTRLGRNTPVPTPIPALAGRSFHRFGAVVWEALSFLTGGVLGDRATPGLGELGAFLAQYHLAATGISVPDRPSATPIGQLAAVVDWSHAATTMRGDDGVQLLYLDPKEQHSYLVRKLAYQQAFTGGIAAPHALLRRLPGQAGARPQRVRTTVGRHVVAYDNDHRA